MIRPPFLPRRAAFSLVELLVVIGIIALLAGILFPTISKVRSSAQEADSRAVLNQIDQACQAYYTDFKAYPGPLSYAMLNAADQTDAVTGGRIIYSDLAGTSQIDTLQALLGNATTETTFNGTGTRVTGAENLVLGLCGGLVVDRATTPGTDRYYIDPSAIGSGPANFNPIRPGKTTAYIQPTNLTKSKVVDDNGNATGVDSIIPEFVDRFSSPMPMLYMRSRNAGGVSTATIQTLVVNNAAVAADYNIVEIQPYTSYKTGSGSRLKPSDYVGVTYDPTSSTGKPHGLRTVDWSKTIDKASADPSRTPQYPYDAYDYFVDPASYDHTSTSLTPAQYAAKRVRKKDSYVLVSAGKDRIYGTADDITNFGSVTP